MASQAVTELQRALDAEPPQTDVVLGVLRDLETQKDIGDAYERLAITVGAKVPLRQIAAEAGILKTGLDSLQHPASQYTDVRVRNQILRFVGNCCADSGTVTLTATNCS